MQDRSDVPLIDQRLVLTKADLEGHKAPRNEESRVIQQMFKFYVEDFCLDFNMGDFNLGTFY